MTDTSPVMQRDTWQTVLLVASLISGCCTPAAVARREVCLIHSEPPSGLPRLYRRANAHLLNLGAAPVLCDVPLAARKLADRCEDVDDLSALLGSGRVCGPAGMEAQSVCPSYAATRLQLERPATSTPLCAAACENRELSIHEASGSVTRILFYDDPACHAAAIPGCPGSERPCYYRVLGITSELR